MRRCLPLLLLALTLVSCRSLLPSRPVVVGRVRVFIESNGPGAVALTLPQSGVRILVDPKPILTEADLSDVAIGELELGRCLMLTLTPPGVKKLQWAAANSPDRRLVLSINDVALGTRRVNEPLTGTVLPVFVEVPDVYLPRLLATIKPSAAETGND